MQNSKGDFFVTYTNQLLSFSRAVRVKGNSYTEIMKFLTYILRIHEDWISSTIDFHPVGKKKQKPTIVHLKGNDNNKKYNIFLQAFHTDQIYMNVTVLPSKDIKIKREKRAQTEIHIALD